VSSTPTGSFPTVGGTVAAGLVALVVLLACSCFDETVPLGARPSERWFPNQSLDLGSSEAGNALTTGWWPTPEGTAPSAFRWATSRRASVTLALPEEARGLRLHAAALQLPPGATQPLRASLDGHLLAETDLTRDWSDLGLPLPSRLTPGLHELTLESVSSSPGPRGDARSLVFAARRLDLDARGTPVLQALPRLAPPDTAFALLRIPGGGVTVLPLPASERRSLDLRCRLAQGLLGVGLRVLWDDLDGRREILRTRVWSRLIRRRLVIPLPSGRPGRLLLECTGRWDSLLEIDGALVQRDLGRERLGVRPGGTSIARPRNLVIYLFDALRADVLGSYGMPRPTSPHLDRISRSGRLFEHLVGHSAWTRPAVATLMTGLLPWDHQAQLRDSVLDQAAVTLAERLAEEGLFTGAVVGNANVARAFGFAKGFERFVEGFTLRDALARHPENPKLRSDDLTEQAALLLDAAGSRPFYLFLHSVDPHFPYVPPPPVRDFEAPAEGQENVRRTYRACVRFNDEELGRVLGLLADHGRLQETLVVLIADHGEEFWDHGGTRHGHSLFEEITHIPLVLSGPGVEPGIETEPLGMSDLMPSLLHALGFLERGSAEERRYDGHIREILRGSGGSSSESFAGQEVLDGRSLAALWNRTAKLIRNRRRVQLFDLARDPGERNDLASGQDVLRDVLAAELLLQLQQAHPLPRGRIDEHGLDPRIEAELKALGYVH
jgi:arylsulfatase A-like enzyme